MIIRRTTPREFTRTFEDLEKMFEAAWSAQASDVHLAMDVYEQDDVLYVQAALPGLRQEDLKITVEGDILTLSGEVKSTWEAKDGTKVYRREQRFGKFTRSIRLPDNVKTDETEASFDQGVVTIKLPRALPVIIEPKVVQILKS